MEQQQELTTEFLGNRHALFAFIYGFVRNTHDAEDIFQEVWVRFFDALQQGLEIDDGVKWCRGTARNLILHHWRDRRNDKVVLDPELLELVDRAFSEQEANRDEWLARQQALQECLQELPERSQRLLRLKYEQGESAQSVADQLTQSVASVWMALSRLRQMLRACTERKMREQGTAQ